MKLRALILGLFIMGLLVLVIPAFAQEVTEVPTAVLTATATPEPGNSGGSFLTPAFVQDIFVLITFLVVGFAAGRYRPGELAREMQKNKQILDTAERISVNTIPVTALETIRQIIKDGKVILDVADKITDGQPNPEDPPATPG